MKRTILGILGGLVVGAAAMWMTLRHPATIAKESKEELPAEPTVVHTNSQVFVRLDQVAQQRAGLKLQPLEAASLKPEVRGFGRVLDPALLVAQVAALATSRAARDASLKEFQRLKILYAQDQNVSTRALEAAEAAVTRDQIAADAAQLSLVIGWSQSIASRPDLPVFVQSLASLETVLVRVDLPLGTVLKSPPIGGRIAVDARDDKWEKAGYLGAAASADPQTQTQGFLLLLTNSLFAPGTAVVGWLTVPGEERQGVLVPRESLVRHEGQAFVYQQTSGELFLRQKIELDHPLPDGWFADEGPKPGERIVIVGAQQLLSEELKGQGGGE